MPVFERSSPKADSFLSVTPLDGTPGTPGTPSGPTIRRVGLSNSPMPSPKTILYVALILAVVTQQSHASPLQTLTLQATASDNTSTKQRTTLESIGVWLSWMCTVLYLVSRVPQLYKNFQLKSTAGLSPTLFAAAFSGNFFYSLSMIANPLAWRDYAPYGGGGWAGEGGSVRKDWLLNAAPFFFGAAGVLIMDALIGLQFLRYGDGEARTRVVLVPETTAALEQSAGGGSSGSAMVVGPAAGGMMLGDQDDIRWQWRRVSGWMRGWMPAVSEAGTPRPGSRASSRKGDDEARALLGGGGASPRMGSPGPRYGAV